MLYTWYLIMIASQAYIGPFSEDGCKAASDALHSMAVCRQATVMKLCPVPEHPEAYTSCPAFDFPQVHIK